MSETFDPVIFDKVTSYANAEDPTVAYRVVRIPMVDVPNPAGGGAGQTVTVAVATPAGFSLPESYVVLGVPGQSANLSVQDKTSSGFNVVLKPLNAGDTIAEGTFDLEIIFEK